MKCIKNWLFRVIIIFPRSRRQTAIISPTYCKAENGSNLLEINNRFIYGKDVLHVKVPHIEGLRTPDIIEFARQHMEIDSYLPEYKTARYPSRRWIWDIGMERCSYNGFSCNCHRRNIYEICSDKDAGIRRWVLSEEAYAVQSSARVRHSDQGG